MDSQLLVGDYLLNFNLLIFWPCVNWSCQ
jgi:hypothetical protein